MVVHDKTSHNINQKYAESCIRRVQQHMTRTLWQSCGNTNTLWFGGRCRSEGYTRWSTVRGMYISFLLKLFWSRVLRIYKFMSLTVYSESSGSGSISSRLSLSLSLSFSLFLSLNLVLENSVIRSLCISVQGFQTDMNRLKHLETQEGTTDIGGSAWWTFVTSRPRESETKCSIMQNPVQQTCDCGHPWIPTVRTLEERWGGLVSGGGEGRLCHREVPWSNMLFGNNFPVVWPLFGGTQIVSWTIHILVVYYEVIKQEVKRRPIYECRCDERLKSTRLID